MENSRPSKTGLTCAKSSIIPFLRYRMKNSPGIKLFGLAYGDEISVIEFLKQ